MAISSRRILQFKKIVWDYYCAHRRDFPWRPHENKPVDAYKILISEIMLQQTQTERVEQKYWQFLRAFPTLQMLASARLRDVLRVWQGLGYNRRAFYLKQLAEIVVKKYAGKLPHDPVLLDALPGVGKATAGAVAAFAFQKPTVFIETNIRRVFIYFFFPRKKRVKDQEILSLVKKTLDSRDPREWYWALMDYGAMLKALPKNPNQQSAAYARQPRFEGSSRQLRGAVVKMLLGCSMTFHEIQRVTRVGQRRMSEVLKNLMRDGLITCRGTVYTIRE